MAIWPERNALPTAAAALGLGDDVVRRLGRWQVGRVTDAYVRSTRQVVARAQEAVADRIRAKGADFLDEAATLDKLARYLHDRGHQGPEVERVIADLTWFDGESATEEEDEEKPVEQRSAPPEAPEDSGTDGETTLTGYVVSVVGRRGYRRLHHLGLCPLVPGVDYKGYILYGEQAPAEDAYDSICRRCWRPTGRKDQAAPARRTGEGSASSASTSGESSDSGAAGGV